MSRFVLALVVFSLALASALAQPMPQPPTVISGGGGGGTGPVITIPLHPFAQSPVTADSLYEPRCPLGEVGVVMVMHGQTFYLICPNDPRPRWIGRVDTSGSISAISSGFDGIYFSTYAGELGEVGRDQDGRLNSGRRWPTVYGQGLVALGNRNFLVASEQGGFRYRINQSGEIVTSALPPAAHEASRGCVQVNDPGPDYWYALCVDRQGSLRSVTKDSGTLGASLFQHPELRSVVTIGGAIYGLVGEQREYIYSGTAINGLSSSYGQTVSRRLAPGSIIRIDFNPEGKPTGTKINQGGDVSPVGAALMFNGRILFANEHWDGSQFSGYSVKSFDPKTGAVTDFISLDAMRRDFGEFAMPGPFFVLPSMPVAPPLPGVLQP